jgi:hypothetical protein
MLEFTLYVFVGAIAGALANEILTRICRCRARKRFRYCPDRNEWIRDGMSLGQDHCGNTNY